MSSPSFPEPPPVIPPTPLDQVDAMVERVAAKKDEWVRTTLPRRIGYLQLCLEGVLAVAPDWVRDGCKRKGIDADTPLAGEEWLAGPMTTARNIRLLIEALEQGGQPKLPGRSRRPDGQEVVSVFPTNLHDKIMFGGLTAEVWIEPGKEASQGAIYRRRSEHGKVSLVLGAGNVSSIPPMDFLYKLFVEDEVVVLKMNPVNADAGPHLERAFRCLIEEGFLAICYGGAEVGAHLADHPRVDTLHVTGSDKTYDAIVWGRDPEEQKRRKEANDPVNKRPFTAELGCVTPVMVVPGDWSEAELDFQARHIVGMVTQNASFNCNAAKVLVVSSSWPQRETFLRKVEEQLARTPSRKAYYPGAQQRYQGFIDQYPKARPLQSRSDEVVPWTIIPDVKPTKDEYALRNEAFCGVLATVALESKGAKEFLEKAVAFANDDCWGTLSCVLLVDPRTQKANSNAVEKALADLRFGGIGLNVWPGIIYGLVTTTWGAFPGHSPKDIQSGAGVVHNSFLLDHPQKSVVRAPFVIKPTPAWFADHKNLAALGNNLTSYESGPSWGRLAKVALAGLKG